jgi:hypothetical protein
MFQRSRSASFWVLRSRTITARHRSRSAERGALGASPGILGKHAESIVQRARSDGDSRTTFRQALSPSRASNSGIHEPPFEAEYVPRAGRGSVPAASGRSARPTASDAHGERRRRAQPAGRAEDSDRTLGEQPYANLLGWTSSSSSERGGANARQRGDELRVGEPAQQGTRSLRDGDEERLGRRSPASPPLTPRPDGPEQDPDRVAVASE